MNKPFSLSKNERIKSKKTIETLFQQGEAFFSYPYRLVYSVNREARQPGLFMAISVPKRLFKRAHERNRIKRLARETYRLQKTALQTLVIQHQFELNLMFIYQARDIVAYNTMEKHMQLGLQGVQQRIFPTPKQPS